MNRAPARTFSRLLLAGCALAALSACGNGPFDPDLRRFGKIGLDTSEAARQATAPRPEPDSRGVISYPNYQVAVARRGDTVSSVASRVGVDAAELAKYNAMTASSTLNKGEVLALPRRVSEPPASAGAATAPAATGSEKIDITTLASGAIDRAEANRPAQTSAASKTTTTTTSPAPAAKRRDSAVVRANLNTPVPGASRFRRGISPT